MPQFQAECDNHAQLRFQVTWLPFGQHGFSKSARRTSTATWLSHGLQCLSFKQSVTTMHNCAFKLPGCHLGSTGSVRAQDAQAQLPGCRMVCSASVSSRVQQVMVPPRGPTARYEAERWLAAAAFPNPEKGGTVRIWSVSRPAVEACRVRLLRSLHSTVIHLPS